MKKQIPTGLLLGSMALVLLLLVVLSLAIGRYPIAPKELLGLLSHRLLGAEPLANTQAETIFFNVRLPRVLLACLVGCSLAAAGAAYQGVFQNPMAAPDILGASSGSAFGACLGLLLGFSGRVISLFSFAAGILSMLLVLFVTKHARGKKVVSLILAGIMVSSLFSAGTSFLKLVADPNEQLPAITYWLMGSFAKTKPADLLFALLPMLAGLLPLLLLSWRINLLTLSDDEAKTMGVNVRRVRIAVILCATLVTAAGVAVSGMIGWVGLVIPHFVRRIAGNNYRRLLPACMLCGAIFMLLVDDVSRNLLATEIPIGILTAFVGAPFFLYLITREGERI